MNIDQALKDPELLGAALGPIETWGTWLVALKAAFGAELTAEELEIFAAIAGSRKPPEKRVSELWSIVGRGGGKVRMAAAIGVFIACFVPHTLAHGETGHVLILAGSRDQAQVVFGYLRGFLESSPILRQTDQELDRLRDPADQRHHARRALQLVPVSSEAAAWSLSSLTKLLFGGTSFPPRPISKSIEPCCRACCE